MLDLVAAAEHIDRKREFPKLLERGAQIAGIVTTDPNLEKRIAERIAANAAQREIEERKRAEAIAAMPAAWSALDRRSLVGERYLQGRGLDPIEMREQGDVVRYTASGEVAVSLRDLATGAIVGIQYREPGGKGFRSAEYSETDDSALAGRIAELDRDGVDVAVLVEGLADTLAARLAFPGCAAFGAAGAAHMDTIAAALAPKLLEVRGWLLVISDDDGPGIEAGAEALSEATAAGLVLDHDLLLVDLGDHHDLADAYAAGWRWTWSS